MPSKNAEHFYTDSEVDILIDDISEAAYEAIDQAAAEAARAAALAALDREAAALREMRMWQTEAEKREVEVREVKKRSVKNVLLTGVISLLSGIAVGVVIANISK